MKRITVIVMTIAAMLLTAVPAFAATDSRANAGADMDRTAGEMKNGPVLPAYERDPNCYVDLTHVDTGIARRICRMSDAGLIRGFNSQRYGPDASLTRAQAASLAWRLLVFSNAHENVTGATCRSAPNPGSNPFRDALPDAHATAIKSMARAGVLEGFPDGTFRPNSKLTPTQRRNIFDRLVRFAGC